MPSEQLAFALQKVMDEKQEQELNDMLVELFELKCR